MHNACMHAYHACMYEYILCIRKDRPVTSKSSMTTKKAPAKRYVCVYDNVCMLCICVCVLYNACIMHVCMHIMHVCMNTYYVSGKVAPSPQRHRLKNGMYMYNACMSIHIMYI